MQKKTIIGSRGSDLALWQAKHVQQKLLDIGVQSEIKIIKTQGDRIQHLSFDKMEGKGFFTKEIEAALIDKQTDIAVHSMKDLQTEMPEGLVLGALSEREDPADWIIAKKSAFQSDAPLRLIANAKVGTSSARRKTFLSHFRSDIVCVDIRGNVQTRISKIESEGLDAVILAAAGLKRLEFDLSEYAIIPLHPKEFNPAPAQGVLAIQCREEDIETRKMLAQIHNKRTSMCTNIERGVLKGMGGGCHMPIGVYCELDSQNNYHVWASFAEQTGGKVKNIRKSSATSLGLVEEIVTFFKS